MVSRKINELQLQREQPECQRLCALTLPQWQRRALLVPSAASHPTTAMPPLPLATACPSPCPFLTAPAHLTAPWSCRGTMVAQNTDMPAWQIQVTAQHCVPHASATILLPRPGSRAAQNTRGGNAGVPLPPPSSPQPQPQRDRRSIFQQCFQPGVAAPKATPCNPWQAGAPGHPQPAAPGCFLPWGHWQRRGQQGWSGRGGRRGLLLLPRLPEN